MPLIPQQDIVVITPPYAPHLSTEEGVAQKLRERLESYPPCRVVSLSHYVWGSSFGLTAVVETI